MIDGHVLQGASHMAGEIGHLVLDPQGHPVIVDITGVWKQFLLLRVWFA